MPDIQGAYNAKQAKGFIGQKVNGEEYNAITRLAEDAAGLAFGKPVSRGAGDMGCLLSTAGTIAAMIGISVRDVSVRPSAGDKYPQYGNVAVLTHGAIWVKVDGTVAPGNPARYDTSTGNFTAAAVAGNVVALPAGWVFDSTAGNGDVAILVKRA